MIPRKRKIGDDNIDSWLMSYADMITLLLCFFIIFVSVSEPKKEKITEIANGVAGKFGALNDKNPFSGALKSMKGTIEQRRLFKDVSVTATEKSVVMELATASLFRDNGADISDEMLPALTDLAGALKSTNLTDYTIVIESHTDDTPPHGLYKNNWELSSMRAARLSQFMVDHGFSGQRIKASGYADTRPQVPNYDAKGNPIPANKFQNQRIVVKLEVPQ